MRKYFLYINCLLVLLLSVVKSYADYPIGKGRSALIGLYSYAYFNKYFDDKRTLIKYPKGDYFSSTSYGLVFMTGLGRKVDFNIGVPFLVQTSLNNNNKTVNAGLGDLNAGLSFHFPSEDYKKCFTIKTGVILPLYQNDTASTPYLGFASKAVQLGAAYSFSPFKQAFATLEATYVRYLNTSEGPNQYRGSATLSKMLSNYTTLTGSFTHQVSNSANTSFSQNITFNKNFESGTLSLSLAQRITRTITPSIQGSYTVYGKNQGQGLSASFLLSIKIP